MIVIQEGIDIIKSFEQLKLEAYYCPAGVLTIGYGHTKDVTSRMKITEVKAEQLLKEDLEEVSELVTKLVKVPLSDKQFSALVSFTFNVGIGNLERSTLLKLLNSGRRAAVPAEMLKWVKSVDPKTKKKVSLAGLVRRRLAETALWNKG